MRRIHKTQTIKGNWKRQAGSLVTYQCGEAVVDVPPAEIFSLHLKMQNSKQKRYIHFGGCAAFHNECGFQCARFLLSNYLYISLSRY